MNYEDNNFENKVIYSIGLGSDYLTRVIIFSIFYSISFYRSESFMITIPIIFLVPIVFLIIIQIYFSKEEESQNFSFMVSFITYILTTPFTVGFVIRDSKTFTILIWEPYFRWLFFSFSIFLFFCF